MFQFLNFTLGSLEQQAMRLATRAKAKDLAVAKVISSAALMGSLMYTARVHMNAAGRGDRDEYIEERMKPENILIGGLQQVGAASLFSYILQITNGGMQGNAYAITPPAIGLAQGILQSGGNIADAVIEGEDMSEQEYRTLLRIAPFQSLYGARQAINAAARELGD